MRARTRTCPLVPAAGQAAPSPVAQRGASQRSWSGLSEGKAKRRFQAVFLLWVIVCASAFLNKMPLSFLWGPLFPVPWVVFLCRFLSTLG